MTLRSSQVEVFKTYSLTWYFTNLVIESNFNRILKTDLQICKNQFGYKTRFQIDPKHLTRWSKSQRYKHTLEALISYWKNKAIMKKREEHNLTWRGAKQRQKLEQTDKNTALIIHSLTIISFSNFATLTLDLIEITNTRAFR